VGPRRRVEGDALPVWKPGAGARRERRGFWGQAQPWQGAAEGRRRERKRRREKEKGEEKKKRTKRKKGNRKRKIREEKIEKRFRKLGEISRKIRREVKKDFCGFSPSPH
jgi:hypothetical protein